MGPHAWHLGIKFLFRPCVAVWGLDWTCLLVFGIWSSVLEKTSRLWPPSPVLLMPLQFPFPLIPLLRPPWAGVPSETTPNLAGQTLYYSPQKTKYPLGQSSSVFLDRGNLISQYSWFSALCLTSWGRSHALSANKMGRESAIVTCVIRRNIDKHTQFSLQLNNLAPILNKWWTR